MKNVTFIGVLSLLALAVVETLGSIATPTLALVEDDEKLKS
jgi:hypothetical protein